ncbi:cysteine peptidase family C39 domain-containing protein [Chryseobacterium sp. P1-3]|uniref:cysteine peptidase family C39 domain-containing protein n=1 Tax=Chryseobacterium sp. (strain P1-3) TaxID=1517683 RepID=UPI000A7CD6FE
MLAKFYGKVYSSEYLRELCNITQDGISVMGMTEAAEKIGFQTLVASINFETLKNQAPLPCIVHWRQRHFVIVYKIEKNKVYVADPEYGLISYTEQKFNEAWQNTKYLNDTNEGLVIIFEPSSEFHNIKEEYKKKCWVLFFTTVYKTLQEIYFPNYSWFYHCEYYSANTSLLNPVCCR